ncbi:unnamed protein product, partial [Linum tenue]
MALRALNAGDAADQVVRQVDRMIKNGERSSRESRFSTRDDQQSNQPVISMDQSRKRSMPLDTDEQANGHVVSLKRTRYDPSSMATHTDHSEKDSILGNGTAANASLVDGDLTPAEQMIAMIGALLGEGERGAESLEILISNIHPDLLADIVITNMKHLPTTFLSLPKVGSLPISRQLGSQTSPAHVIAPPIIPTQSTSLAPSSHVSTSAQPINILSQADTSNANTFPTDSKRDPRRDPRRLDPRRTMPPAPTSIVDDIGVVESEFDGSSTLSKSSSFSVPTPAENDLDALPLNYTVNVKEEPTPELDQVSTKDEGSCTAEELVHTSESDIVPEHSYSLPDEDNRDALAVSDFEVAYDAETSFVESDEYSSPADSKECLTEETFGDLAELPLYVELDEAQQRNERNTAIERIIESYGKLSDADCGSQMRMALLARLVAQAKSLLDAFPASDKSFCRLLGEVPLLSTSALKLLENLCYCDVFDSHGNEVRDVERVTQGLGAVWSLILGRPKDRQACLDIALKCAVHSQDDVRAKAIRLVANKLYQLSYISENIEQFATSMLLSAVDQQSSDVELSQSASVEQREGEVGTQEALISGSQV